MRTAPSALALALSLSCALPAAADKAPGFPTGIDWRAEKLGTTPFETEALPTLRVDGKGRVFGSSGCNRYTGSIQIAGAKLTVGPIAQTKMFCMGPGGQNELRFSAAIGSASSWRMDGKALVIETANGALRFKRK